MNAPSTSPATLRTPQAGPPPAAVPESDSLDSRFSDKCPFTPKGTQLRGYASGSRGSRRRFGQRADLGRPQQAG
jgi:hypothetical protein